MCDCLAILGRILIGVLSLIFAIIGFGLLIIGIIVKVNVDTLSQLWDPLIESAKSQAQSAVGQNIEIPTENFGPLIENLVGGLAIAFIVLGVIMLVVGVFGVAGACCMVKCMIIGYLICMTLLTLGTLTVVIILVVDKGIVLAPAKAELAKTVKQEYRGLNDTSVTSLLWNTIMSWQQCCGVNGYKDFGSPWSDLFGPSTILNFEVPAACCKSGKFSPPSSVSCTLIISPDNNKDVAYELQGRFAEFVGDVGLQRKRPLELVSLPSSRYDCRKVVIMGCFDKLINMLLDGSIFIGFSAGTVGGSALLTFFAAVILYKIIKRNKVKPL